MILDQNIFNYLNYRDYLKFRLGDKKNRTGLKSKLAIELQIKSSFLSRIINGESNLTLEHAYQTAEFLKLTELEKEFFIELVLLERAGHYQLKEFHKKKH